jgi:CheY-like chemotaxis protein
MCTGSTYEKDRQRAQSLGAVGYLVKPPSLEQLQPILEQAASVQLLSCAGNGYTLVRAA